MPPFSANASAARTSGIAAAVVKTARPRRVRRRRDGARSAAVLLPVTLLLETLLPVTLLLVTLLLVVMPFIFVPSLVRWPVDSCGGSWWGNFGIRCSAGSTGCEALFRTYIRLTTISSPSFDLVATGIPTHSNKPLLIRVIADTVSIV